MASTINFLKLLADPTRLRLLLLLEEDELSVAELQKILGMGQSRISSHLAQLKRAGVVEARRFSLLCENAVTKRANISTSWRENSGAVMSRAGPGRRSRIL